MPLLRRSHYVMAPPKAKEKHRSSTPRVADARRGPPTFGGLGLEEAIPLWFPVAENWDPSWFIPRNDLKRDRLSEAD
eukprot:15318167-Heterocapsa_arctica.AAC.1